MNKFRHMEGFWQSRLATLSQKEKHLCLCVKIKYQLHKDSPHILLLLENANIVPIFVQIPSDNIYHIQHSC